MSGLTAPAGDPGQLEQFAALLDDAATGSASLGVDTRQVTESIRSGAQWTGDAADAYTAFTGDLSQGAAAAEGPLSRISLAVRGYAGYLRIAKQKVAAYNSAAETAQVSGSDPGYVSAAELAGQDAQGAIDAWQEAGDRAAAEVRAAAEQFGSLYGANGPVQGWLGRQTMPWDTLSGLPGQGDPSGPETLINTPGEPGPLVVKDPIFQPGNEILINTPEGPGLLVVKDPIFQPGNETLINTPGPPGPLINFSKDEEDLPQIDGTGKVHTPPGEDLPGHIPGDWTTEDLEQLESDLQVSIARRQQEQIDLGEEPRHRTRINDEIRLLRQIQKRLSGS